MNKTQKSLNFATLCNSCSHQNCCTDSQEPILFENDLLKLNSIGKNTEEFLQTLSINGKEVKAIRKKQNSSECIFWSDSLKQCLIYEHRPFDCKAYPFDILKVDGKYHWIVYSCNEKSDWEWSEKYLQMLESDSSFNDILKNIDVFAQNTQRILPIESEKTSYKILREVKKSQSILHNFEKITKNE